MSICFRRLRSACGIIFSNAGFIFRDFQRQHLWLEWPSTRSVKFVYDIELNVQMHCMLYVFAHICFLFQTVFAPISMTAFLIVLRILEGNSLQTAINRWKSDVLDIYLTSLKVKKFFLVCVTIPHVHSFQVWPAVQLVNFYFVPLEHRLLLVQSVALLWNTYLAWRTSRGV